MGATGTTGGVPGRPCPLLRPGRWGPEEPRLGVVPGELWLVAGDETGEDSMLREQPAGGVRRENKMN